ncbi:hypothetical protein CPB86DRAFT_105702 [Serendipita vermifera]|nr:hypothetical protein CPB86DRAFT_105702 [Serendipita vermifera]
MCAEEDKKEGEEPEGSRYDSQDELLGRQVGSSRVERRAREADGNVESQKGGLITDMLQNDYREKKLSPFERLPYDVFDLIFSHLPQTSLAACALTSIQIHSAVTRALYTKVNLQTDRLTRIFEETLLCRPFLCDYVRDLTIAVKPHWESVRVLHDILKKLPHLISLHTLPSWITYGNLPYWEYPFKLHTLKWGLMKDKASQKFIASQSDTLKEVGYLKIKFRSDEKDEKSIAFYDHNSFGMPTYWVEGRDEWNFWQLFRSTCMFRQSEGMILHVL